MPSYRLERPWFNGSALLKRGTVVELPEGVQAPSTAVRLEEPEPELDFTVPVVSLASLPPKPVAKAKA